MSAIQEQTTLKSEKAIRSNGIFVDFNIVREVWDIHKLSDGTKVKARVILTSLMVNKELQEIEKEIRNDEKPTLGASFNFQTIIVTESPIELRGQAGKAKHTKEELKSAIIAPNLDFETMYQSWNIYNLGYGHTLKSRLTPIDISRTNQYDDNGMPVYILDFSIDAKLELSPDLQKIIEKNKARNQAPQ